MSDHDKLTAFGTWLMTKRQSLQNELNTLATNCKIPNEQVRVKGGQLEATQFILVAFSELYNGDLVKFRKERLGETEEEEDEESTGST